MTKIQNATIETYNTAVKSLNNLWKQVNREVTKKDEQLVKYANYLFNMLTAFVAKSEVIS